MPKVLVFIEWFLPAYKAGGPIRSVSNLITQLGSELSISVVASDRDFGDGTPLLGIETGKWIEKENYRIVYLKPNQQTYKYYRELLNEQVYNYVYLNSLFSLRFTLIPLWIANKLGVKIILAPRGMLGEGALNFKKMKKNIFLYLFKSLGYHKRVTWHATGYPESLEIEKYFGESVEIKRAPNLSNLMYSTRKHRVKKKNQLNVFFLSRIAEKKNLKFAIELLQAIKYDIKVEFAIIGPVGEESYWEKCQQLIKQLPSNIKVVFTGPIPNKDISKCLENQHFLLLPTFHENFGHVFIESWSNGCPVIISDQTPWRNLEEKGVGWDISLKEKSKFIEAIEKAALMNQEAYWLTSEASFEFAQSFRESPEVLEANRNLFNLS